MADLRRPVLALIGSGLCSSVWANCSGYVDEGYLALEKLTEGSAVFRQRAPQAVEIDLWFHAAANDCGARLVAGFEIEGGSPRLDDTFVYPLDGEPNVFAIVSWPMIHVGEGLRGRYYAVQAYHFEAGTLILNERVARNRDVASGIVGTVQGEESHFEGTTRQGVIRLLSPPATEPEVSEPDWAGLCNLQGNQGELNACAFAELADANIALRNILQELSVWYDGTEEVLVTLDSAQTAWRTQVDVDLQNLFPLGLGDDPRVLYGSSYPMNYAYARAHLVRQRVDFLRAFWLPVNAR